MAGTLDGGLLLIVSDTLRGDLHLWAPSDRRPSRVPLTSRPDIASFDTSGTTLMYETLNGETSALHLGRPATGQPAVFAGVRGAHWHPTTQRSLAWVAQLPTEPMPSLYTATADVTFGTIESATRVVDLPHPSPRLAAWGDWGFAISWPLQFTLETEGDTDVGFSSVALTILDPSGVPQRTTVGQLLATGGSDTLVVAPRDQGFDVTPFVDPALTGEVVILDDQVVITDATLSPIAVSFTVDADTVAIEVTPDGEWLLQIARNDEGMVRVTANRISRPSTRSSGIGGGARTIGVTADSQHLLLQDLASNELIIFNWEAGTTFRIPVEDGAVTAALLP